MPTRFQSFQLRVAVVDSVGLQVIGVVALVCAVIPYVLIPLLPMCIAFVFLRRYYLKTSREVGLISFTCCL